MHSRIEDKDHKTATKIYYWNGIIDPLGLSSQYDDILGKLADGNYQGLDLEKLVGHDVYSVRVNQCDRLLFTTIIVNSKPYLMLLDEVLNHDYAKSKFLKPAVLKHYLELHGKAISEELISTHFEVHPGLNLPPAAPQKSIQAIQYSRIDFYNQKFIELDAGQLDAATKTSLPLIISGAPGSGKSCIALLILGQYVESNQEKKDYPILYVTESENLASSMRRAWLALPVSQGLDAKGIQIISYQQLIKELVPKSAQMTFVDKEHCKTWLCSRIKQSANQRKGKNSLSKEFFADLDSLYQELRIISVCSDLAEYMALGQRQCLYHEQDEKRWLFSAFTTYQTELEKTACIHAPFYHLGIQNQYKRIVADEAQDFSHLQLKSLSMLACNRQICFCEDNRQSLSDNKSKVPFLKTLMHSWGLKDNQIILPASYRCPPAVIRMANAASGLKSKATGEGQPDIVAPMVHTNEGKVSWFDRFTDSDLAALQQAAQSPDFAIVTLKEYKDEARKLFNTALVFTADECKGLEYRHILVYRLLDAPLFKEADKVIGDNALDFKKTANRAKKDQGQEQFGPSFNGLYTAFTRATDSLTVFQKKHHYLKNICNSLLKSISGEQATSLDSNTMTQEENLTQWFQQVRVQIVNGNIEIAKAIYLEKLHKTLAEFEEFRALFAEAAPIVVNPEPSSLTSTSIVTQSHPEKLVRRANQDTSVSTSKPDNVADDSKIYIYLNNLVKNASEENINSLLRHRKAREFLFNYPLKDGECLFTRLFYEPGPRNIFINCMKNYISIVAGGIGEDALCRARTSPNEPFGNTSPLYWLSSTSRGQFILKLLFLQNPKIYKFITAEALCLACTRISEPFANTSALYWFSTTSDGQKLLKSILNGNPKLAKSISADALCKVRTAHAGEEANISPLYWLAATPEGRVILKILFNKNPKLVHSISADSLCLVRTSEAGEQAANTSPFYFLSATTEGREKLLSMLTANPKMAQSITADALYLTRTATSGEYAFTSSLYWLSGATEGLKILKILLFCNPELAQSVSAEALCCPRGVSTVNDVNVSTLYILSSTIGGVEILKILFTCSSKIVQQVFAEALCLPCITNHNAVANTSPLYMLSLMPEGQELLLELLTDNPELAKYISAEALCRALGNAAGENANTSTLYWFSYTRKGHDILKILLTNNQELVQSISPDELWRMLVTDDAKKSNTSILYWLSQTATGWEIFKILLTGNPKLVDSFKPEALHFALMAGEASSLNWLASSVQGQEILETMYVNDPELSILFKDYDLRQFQKLAKTFRENELQFSSVSRIGFFSKQANESFNDEKNRLENSRP